MINQKRKSKLIFLGLIFIIILLNGMLLKNYSNAQSNITLVLDPGHGGIDKGASGYGLIERDINLKIAKHIKDELSKYAGIDVYLTHYGLESNVKLELDQRANIAKDLGADLVISLHINAVGGTGAEVFVTRDTILPKYNLECTKLGNLILQKLGNLGIYNRGVKTKIGNTEADKNPSIPREYYYDNFEVDYYGMIRHPRLRNIPGIVLEHCFIDNANDVQFINTDEKIKQIAEADVAAIVEYYGLVLKSAKPTGISVNKSEFSLIKDKNIQITPTITPVGTGKNNRLIWKSNNEGVATVDANGNVRGISIGTAEITIDLVLDETGYINSIENSYLRTKFNINVIELDGTQTITKAENIKLIDNGTIITGIEPNTTLSSFNGISVENLQIDIVSKSGVILSLNDLIKTGDKILIKFGDTIIEEYVVVIYGDVSGDGKTNLTDALLIERNYVGLQILENEFLKAGSVINRSSKITLADALKIKRHYVELEIIKQ